MFRKYVQDAEVVIAIGSDPWGTLREAWRVLSAEDLWAEHPAEAAGRVTFEIASIVIPIAKIATVARASRAARSAGLARSFPTVEDLVKGFFGKENAGQSIRIGGKDLKDLGIASKPAHVRIVDGTVFRTEARMRDAVLDYAEELAGKPLHPARNPPSDGSFLRTTEVTRPDGTEYTINVRSKSSSANLNGADVRLTLELIDKKNFVSNGWPSRKLELKFSWKGN